MGGANKRMEDFAHFIQEELGIKSPTGQRLYDITAASHRFALYKIGPVISVSHGMGVASLGILLHEMIKLMYHAKCKDPIFIRIGTSGGIGVEGGTVIVSNGAVDGRLRSIHEETILGELVQRPAIMNQAFAEEIRALARPEDDFKTVVGKTMCANDFYEGQGRLDGAFCEYTEADKLKYLNRLHAFGVVNIEMECTMFAAFTHYSGIKSAIICAALLNRLNGDQITTPKSVMASWTQRPQMMVARLIRKHLAEGKPATNGKHANGN
jgi:uridine phosphorylase